MKLVLIIHTSSMITLASRIFLVVTIMVTCIISTPLHTLHVHVHALLSSHIIINTEQRIGIITVHTFSCSYNLIICRQTHRLYDVCMHIFWFRYTNGDHFRFHPISHIHFLGGTRRYGIGMSGGAWGCYRARVLFEKPSECFHSTLCTHHMICAQWWCWGGGGGHGCILSPQPPKKKKVFCPPISPQVPPPPPTHTTYFGFSLSPPSDRNWGHFFSCHDCLTYPLLCTRPPLSPCHHCPCSYLYWYRASTFLL